MNPAERYVQVEKLASGSFATVYRAEDRELGREVAVKQIHEHFLEDPQQLERYWAEAQLLASLQHPNIVTIYDIVRERGWLIMELMQGNLADRQQGRALDLVSLRTVLAHCLRALRFLHEHGVIHGDIKPGNIMIDRRKRIKLGDFGLARRVSDEEGSLIKGTTKYMAPEVVSDEFGDVGPASDLYSLGFSAYELMCGSQFDSLFPGLSAHGRDRQLAWIMWHAAPDRRLPEIKRVLEGVPEDLAHIIQKLCTKDRAQRYQSAEQALIDLNVDLRVVKVEDKDAPDLNDAAAIRKRRLLIGAFGVSMLLSLGMLFFPGSSEPKRPTVQSGIVREVRQDKRELVLVDEASGVPEVIPMGAKPSLLLANTQKKILLEEVQPGDRVRLKPVPQGVEFVLSRPEITQGTILRIDPVMKLIVVQNEQGATREELPVTVDEQAHILLNKDKASFSDLEVGDRVSVEHLPNPRDENRHKALEVGIRRTVRATGVVKVVGMGTPKKLVFDVRQGQTMRTLEVPFADNCVITLPDQRTITPVELQPDDLRGADRIVAEYDLEITELTATRNKSVVGTLRAINYETRVVRVLSRGGEDREMFVPTEAEIDLVGEVADLDELREYDEIRATFKEIDGEREAVTLDATRPARHDRFAIVISVQNYDDRTISRPRYALDDGQALVNALRNRYCVAPERLIVLKDPTREQILSAFGERLQNLLGETQVLVFFEGQSYNDENGKAFLAARDTQLKQLATTGLALSELVQRLEAIPPEQKLLVLDTAHQGMGSDLMQQVSPAEIAGPVRLKSLQILASGRKDQRNRRQQDHTHSLFGEALVEGIKGRADLDRDLTLTPTELANYVELKLTQPPADDGPSLTPQLFVPQ